MVRKPAPVALFAYRRPEHLARTLESLASCPQAQDTELTVFSDGARQESDATVVEDVRRIAGGADGFASVRLIARPVNLGLAGNIISGVTQMLQERDRVIVLEDDLLLSPDFLAYMNTALDLYAEDEQVASIHGYVYPTRTRLPQTFFLRGADCWGWATWRRGWAAFNQDGEALLRDLEGRGLTGEFDLDGRFPFTQMLRDQVAGRNDSWAIRWHASAFLADLLTLYPGASLVRNIGLDGSGTHIEDGRGLDTGLGRVGSISRIPIVESEEAREAIAEALRTREGPRGSIGRLLGWLRR